ncbi:ParA family protein [Thermodesulfovibrio hydrogeniphilus]
MGKILSIVNQKGGVGKTTTALNLGTCLAIENKKVLLVDSDPQGNLTTGLGINKESLEGSLYELFIGSHSVDKVLIKTQIENLWIIPSTIDLVGVEVELIQRENREFILKNILSSVSEDFDYILIDAPPSLGLLTLNCLVASDAIIIPVQCEYYALEGLGLLMRTFELVKILNPNIKIQGILLTMFDARNTLSRQVVEEVRKFFGGKVYNTIIPRNVALAEAPSHGKPAVLYDIRSKGAQSYITFALEFLLNEKGAR